MDRPIGVEAPTPSLSWRLESIRRGARQTAYRIQVARSADALAAGRADLWDSGRVDSDDTIGIRYAGAPLTSRQRCYWRVLVWDERGLTIPPSEICWWEMGLLNADDWIATWIAAEDAIMRADRDAGFAWHRGALSDPKGAAAFRFVVDLPHAGDASLFLVGGGTLNLWVDGTATMLPPAPTSLGMPPTIEIPLRLDAGHHMIAVSVEMPNPAAIIGVRDAELGVLLRARLADGRIVRPRLSATTFPELALGWTAPTFDEAGWKTAEPVTEPRSQAWQKQPGVLLRRPFAATRPVAAARLYVTALGGYVGELNGRRIGTDLLAPQSSDYRKRLLYRVHDVTEMLVAGENLLGFHVGDGWYASYALGSGRYAWGPPPRRLLAQLEIDYVDGTHETVSTGPGWQIARSPVVSSEIYDGEIWDARLEQPGWSKPGFDATGWEAASAADAPKIALIAQVSAPIAAEMMLVPKRITEPTPGVFVIDFGQNFAGWCRVRVKGKRGARMAMRFAEILRTDGEVDQSNLRAALATDNYILRGDPSGEVFEPQFTYHGFRYVQVSGLAEKPTESDFEGVVVHSALSMTSNLTIDNALVQALWRNTQWSQRSNFMGIPTDCPQRDERLGWMGDANVFWDAAAFNMDVESFTRTYMGDVRDAQAEDGAFSDFSPAAFKFPPPAGQRIGASPGWADAGICLPWTVWQRYGDAAIIDENWDAMSRYLRFIAEANADHIWRKDRGADFGDWLALDAKEPGDPTTPKELVATAMWAHSVNCMAQMAEATGRAAAATLYRTTHAAIVRAFGAAFVTADARIGNDSQTGYILALRYGLVPPPLHKAAAERLVANIHKRGTLLTTGFLGTPNSLDVLADAGFGNLAYTLLLRTEFPSWGYMVAKGATTIWERWNGDTGDVSMNSFNHYALGAIMGFVFRRIAGISPLQPGFRRISVKPVLDPRVRTGGASYQSAVGPIETKWRQGAGGKLALDLVVPANCGATVTLPATAMHTVSERGMPFSTARGIRVISRSASDVTVETGSGDFRFEVS